MIRMDVWAVTMIIFQSLPTFGKDGKLPSCMGSANAPHQIIYLHGMDTQQGTAEELKNRKILEEMALLADAQVALPRSPFRCKDQLCWPYQTSEAREKSYEEIRSQANQCGIDINRAGFVAFSNGGYFFHRLFQDCEVRNYGITAGAAGQVMTGKNLQACGKLAVIAGQKEQVFAKSQQFAQLLGRTRQAAVGFFQHDGGHHLPEASVLAAIVGELDAMKKVVKTADSANEPAQTPHLYRIVSQEGQVIRIDSGSRTQPSNPYWSQLVGIDPQGKLYSLHLKKHHEVCTKVCGVETQPECHWEGEFEPEKKLPRGINIVVALSSSIKPVQANHAVPHFKDVALHEPSVLQRGLSRDVFTGDYIGFQRDTETQLPLLSHHLYGTSHFNPKVMLRDCQRSRSKDGLEQLRCRSTQGMHLGKTAFHSVFLDGYQAVNTFAEYQPAEIRLLAPVQSALGKGWIIELVGGVVPQVAFLYAFLGQYRLAFPPKDYADMC